MLSLSKLSPLGLEPSVFGRLPTHKLRLDYLWPSHWQLLFNHTDLLNWWAIIVSRWLRKRNRLLPNNAYKRVARLHDTCNILCGWRVLRLASPHASTIAYDRSRLLRVHAHVFDWSDLRWNICRYITHRAHSVLNRQLPDSFAGFLWHKHRVAELGSLLHTWVANKFRILRKVIAYLLRAFTGTALVVTACILGSRAVDGIRWAATFPSERCVVVTRLNWRVFQALNKWVRALNLWWMNCILKSKGLAIDISYWKVSALLFGDVYGLPAGQSLIRIGFL